MSCRVFCFPHAAGSASFYRPLRDVMPAGIDFCPVELPGRAARLAEAPITDIGTLLASLSGLLRPLMTVPFAFFGHSTGAAIAYRAAHALRAADGRRALHLFVSARAAPGSGETSLASLSDAQLLLALKRFGGTPDAVMTRGELVAPLLAAMRADLALGQSCAAVGQRLAGPITVFGGTDDAIDRPLLQGWRSFTTGSFRLRLFAGGHFYFTRSVEVLAAEIAEDLSQALRGERMCEAG